MMNSYRRAMKIRELNQKEHKNQRLLVKLMREHKLMSEYEVEYQLLHGRIPYITKSASWFIVKDGPRLVGKYQTPTFRQAIRMMQAKLHEKEVCCVE